MFRLFIFFLYTAGIASKDILYDERLSAYAAAAAYSDDPTSCNNVANIFNFTNIISYKNETYFFVYAANSAYERYDVILSFRGTVNNTELHEEVKKVWNEGKMNFPNGTGKVSKYFYEKAMMLYDGIGHDFNYLLNETCKNKVSSTGAEDPTVSILVIFSAREKYLDNRTLFRRCFSRDNGCLFYFDELPTSFILYRVYNMFVCHVQLDHIWATENW